MTVEPVPAPAEARPGSTDRLSDRLRSPVVQLNLLGVVLVATAVVPTHAGPSIVAATALGIVALAAWATWALLKPGRGRDVAIAIGSLAAAAGTGLGTPSLLAPLIAGLLVAISDIAARPPTLVGFVLVATAVVTVAGVLHGMALDSLLSLVAGIAVGTLGGITRRQRRFAEVQQRELLASTLATEREAQRVQLLESRSAAARDVHDVLAHSLGGLVLQLDAIEALLEHGRVAEAATRAADARRLAGDGLAEARRAVTALRDPDAASGSVVPDTALASLVAEHHALGGEADVVGDPTLSGIDDPHREALAGALREALVNARRHAPGQRVRIRFRREPTGMMLRVENPIPDRAGASVGGGHGLTGMRERFAALGDGSTASAGPRVGSFVVEAHAVLR